MSVALKRIVILGLTVAKNVNFKLSGEKFFSDINDKNNGAIVIPRFSTTCLISTHEFLVT